MVAGEAALHPAEGTPDEAARARRLQRLAAILAVVAVAEAFGILLIGGLGDPRFRLDISLIPFAFLANVVLFPVMGALIAQRRPYTRVAWLMITLGVALGYGLVTFAYGVVGQPPRNLPLALPLLLISQVFFIPAIAGATTWILLLYPTDRLLGPRWRWVGALAILSSFAFIVGSLLRPGELDPTDLPGLLNPIGVGGAAGQLLGTLADTANGAGLLSLILGASSLVVRYGRADPIVAAQIRWLALVAILDVITLGLSLVPMADPLNDLLFGLGLTGLAAIPIAIGIAITRYRLYEIDRLINRALVYGSLTAILAGVFTAAIGLAQRLFVATTGQTSDGAIVATTLVVATLYAPLRKRLEAIVDRWFKYESRRFGAYRAQLVAYLDLAEPREAVDRLAHEAYAELDPAGLAVVDHAGEVIASAGIWPQPIVIRLPIGRGSRSIGTLLIGPRRDGRPHDAREVEDLADLAILVGSAART
jgi:hypothetical protein